LILAVIKNKLVLNEKKIQHYAHNNKTIAFFEQCVIHFNDSEISKVIHDAPEILERVYKYSS